MLVLHTYWYTHTCIHRNMTPPPPCPVIYLQDATCLVYVFTISCKQPMLVTFNNNNNDWLPVLRYARLPRWLACPCCRHLHRHIQVCSTTPNVAYMAYTAAVPSSSLLVGVRTTLVRSKPSGDNDWWFHARSTSDKTILSCDTCRNPECESFYGCRLGLPPQTNSIKHLHLGQIDQGEIWIRVSKQTF